MVFQGKDTSMGSCTLITTSRFLRKGQIRELESSARFRQRRGRKKEREDGNGARVFLQKVQSWDECLNNTITCP